MYFWVVYIGTGYDPERGWTPPGENLSAGAEFLQQKTRPTLQEKFAIGKSSQVTKQTELLDLLCFLT